MSEIKKKEIYRVLFVPVILLIIIWGVKIIECLFQLSFINYGVFPQKISGLKGIFLSPFIHKDFKHILNNSYPLLMLIGLLFSFYKKIAFQILIWLYLISGFWLWIIGRPAFHIGASGVIYALAGFLFLSGLIRKNRSLSAISLLVIFLYGSLIWGIIPISKSISWEGHLSGFLAGLLVAVFFKKEGPERKKYQWEIEEEQEKEEGQDVKYFIKHK